MSSWQTHDDDESAIIYARSEADPHCVSAAFVKLSSTLLASLFNLGLNFAYSVQCNGAHHHVFFDVDGTSHWIEWSP
jgi:hypothetical protein